MTIDTPPEAPWLDSEERAAWMTLITMLMTLPAAIDAQLKRDSGLNFFEYSILSHLSQPQEHAVQMSNLAHLAGGSLSRLSHAVSRLEKQGFVTRRTGSDGESRCVQAFLTPAGYAALVKAAPAHVREARRLVFDNLSTAQVRQMHKIAHEIAEAASPDSVRRIDDAIAQAERAEREGRADPCVPGGC
ncbi:MarR family winged helix-turn-helix transcriptional regulator [Actinoplanes sp. TRM 88003]|uniref:MarR family winged helix-turn-helix transcriptional regulator n=1 Tax=Paractinoplanes aksuensis TaxID=2939490 RepID=A0ABT1E603_9ACTN|nr:MarR family winged helix-turn-helix transcriptional regulator [Actinoplanes aksuensis]MCO8277241.1 MarR family winged helix-turn-helix transcriptional regulator [Actinoplanes aksuensis]